MIDEWLLEKDSYIPKGEKNSYIEKSIFSMVKTVSIIRENKIKEGIIYHINPLLKVVISILSLIAIAITRSFIYVGIFDIYLLSALLMMNKRDGIRIIKMSLIFPIITFIALIPAILMGNIYNSLLILQKVLSTIVLMSILSHTTRWSDINKALKLMFIPDIIIWIMDITIKYIVLLAEYSIDLLFALKLRSVGSSKNKNKFISSIVGNVFLKSYKMSEEMSSAMECRGFVGEYSISKNLTFKKYDYIYVIINLGLFILFIIKFV